MREGWLALNIVRVQTWAGRFLWFLSSSLFYSRRSAFYELGHSFIVAYGLAILCAGTENCFSQCAKNQSRRSGMTTIDCPLFNQSLSFWTDGIDFDCIVFMQVLKEIVESCRAQEFSDLIMVHEHRGQPDGLIVCHLPYGPTAYFGLSNVVSTHIHSLAHKHFPSICKSA